MKLVKYILIGTSAITVVGVSSFCVVQANKNAKTTEVAKVDSYIEKNQADNSQEINELKNELANTKTIIEELQNQINNDKSEKAESKNEQTVLKSEENANIKVSDANKKANTVTIEKIVEKQDTKPIEDLQQQLDKTETDLNNFSKENKEKQEDLNKMADKRMSLQEELKNLQKEANELGRKYGELNNKQRSLQNEYTEISKKLAITKVDELSVKEVNQLKVRQQEIKSELDNGELVKQIQETKNKYDEKIDEISAKQKEIDKLIIDMVEFD